MLLHYIKVALRNLIKYKIQTVLSIVGLAIGFACFALSVTWIRYEMSYDTFHPNSDRIYAVIETQNNAMVKTSLKRPLAELFQKTYPEVELATMVEYRRIQIEGNKKELFFLETDTAFSKMFPYPFEKNLYTQPTSDGSSPMIVTKEKMQELADSAKGRIGTIYERRQIVGTMKGFPINSRFHCDAICAVVPPSGHAESYRFALNGRDIFLLLKEGVDVRGLEKKISTIDFEGEKHHYILVPLSELRYKYPDHEASLKFGHIVIFACAGVLLILCALFNYITLFITRIRMRGREMALRKVYGSSNSQLISLFSTEYILLLFFSLFIGEVIIELCMPKFITLSDILYTRGAIYGETLAYALLLIGFSFVVGIIPISYFRRKTLQASIQPLSGPIRHLFYKATLILQLIISIGLIFAIMILFKQVYFMTHEGTGLDSNNVWHIDIPHVNEVDYAEKIAQIPSVKEVSKQYSGYFPGKIPWTLSLSDNNEKGETITHYYNMVDTDEECLRFYKFTFLIGEPFKEGQKDVVIVNESFLKQQNGETLQSIMGKKVAYGNVVGVVKNFYIGSQTEEQKPLVLTSPYNDKNVQKNALYYRVMDGKGKKTNEAIRRLLEKEIGSKEIQFYSLEEHLEKVYRSERALLYMLGIITGVCILISIFGIYSMVSLTCQQRRKEIAIRKVFGATVAQILHSFFREYAVLLGIAALIAFPVATYLMRLWLEQYVRQTSIDGWIYLVILALVALIILVTIWSRVWKAASANPADVVKSE